MLLRKITHHGFITQSVQCPLSRVQTLQSNSPCSPDTLLYQKQLTCSITQIKSACIHSSSYRTLNCIVIKALWQNEWAEEKKKNGKKRSEVAIVLFILLYITTFNITYKCKNHSRENSFCCFVCAHLYYDTNHLSCIWCVYFFAISSVSTFQHSRFSLHNFHPWNAWILKMHKNNSSDFH